jgi:hypothetical protein
MTVPAKLRKTACLGIDGFRTTDGLAIRLLSVVPCGFGKLDTVGEFPKQRTYVFCPTEFEELTRLKLNSPTISNWITEASPCKRFFGHNRRCHSFAASCTKCGPSLKF